MNARLKVTRFLGAAVFAMVAATGALSVPVMAADYPDGAIAKTSCQDISSGTYYLANNITCPFTVTSGDVKLYLNGHSVILNQANAVRPEMGAIMVREGAKLEIFGDGALISTASGRAALANDRGEVVLHSGTYQAYYGGTKEATYYSILNEGKMTINDGVTVKTNAPTADASLIANGPTVMNVKDDSATGEIVINGGEFVGGNVNLKNDEGGTATINGGAFTGATNAAIQNWNKLTINGGNFNYKPSTTDARGRALIDMGAYDSNHPSIGETVINGGSFNGKYLFEDASTPGPVFYPSTIRPVITGGGFNIEALVNPEYEADGSVLGDSTITGGVFAINTFTPADGYELKELADGKYEVVKHVDKQPTAPSETPGNESQDKAGEITAPSTGTTLVSAAVVVLGAIVAIAMSASAVNTPSSRRK